MTRLTDTDFIKLTERYFRALDEALGAVDLDIDWQYQEDVFTIELPDGAKIILNRHQPMQEIWLAARSGGFHFQWDGFNWRDNKTGALLLATLNDVLSRHTEKNEVLLRLLTC